MTSSWKVAQVKSDPHSYVWISTIGGSIPYFRHLQYKPKPVYHLSWPRKGNLMVNFGITAPPPRQAQWRNLSWPTLFSMQTCKSCRSVSQALQLQLAHTTCTKASYASGRAYWFVFIRLKRGVPIPLHVNGSMHVNRSMLLGIAENLPPMTSVIAKEQKLPTLIGIFLCTWAGVANSPVGQTSLHLLLYVCLMCKPSSFC